MKKTHFRILGISTLMAYAILLGLLLYNFFGVNAIYHDTEMKMITEVEQKISEILVNNDEKYMKHNLDTLKEEYLIDIMVSEGNEVLYTSVPYEMGENLLERSNKGLVAREAQGPITINGHDYFLWYNIYHLSDSEFMNSFLKMQVIIVSLSLIVLGAMLFILQKLLVKPLEMIRENIESVDEYDFEKVKTSDDVINKRIYDFSSKLETDISSASAKYTELEKELQENKVHMNDTLVVGRSMVHDLKTPIHRNILENEIMMKESEDDLVKKNAKYNIELNEEVMKEVNEALSVLKNDSSKPATNFESIDLSFEIARALTRFNVNLEKKGLNVDYIADNCEIESDRNSVTLLIHNLLSNMSQYSKQGSDMSIDLKNLDDSVEMIFTNESSLENIERMKQSGNLFNAIRNEEHEYSSGNGLYLIENLTRMIDGEYELRVENQTVQITITLPKEPNDEKNNH